MLLSIIAAAQAKLTSASNDSKCSVLIAYTGMEGSACILDALLLPEEQLADFKAIQG